MSQESHHFVPFVFFFYIKTVMLILFFSSWFYLDEMTKGHPLFLYKRMKCV